MLWEPWTGNHTFSKAPLAVLQLLCSSTNIISASIPKDVAQSLRLGNVAAVFADDEGELGLIVRSIILGDLGDVDLGGIGTIEGCSWLDEQYRNIWNGHIGLLCVVSIVETETSDQCCLLHGDW